MYPWLYLFFPIPNIGAFHFDYYRVITPVIDLKRDMTRMRMAHVGKERVTMQSKPCSVTYNSLPRRADQALPSMSKIALYL